jgi:RND family efflux transporter MFP subunit
MKHCSRLAVAIALPAMAGCGGGNEFVAPPPPAVTVATPQQRPVTTHVEFTGRTAALEEIEVRARVQGFLQSIEFTDGDTVEKGTLLFRIEPEQYQAVLAAAKAELAGKQAALSLAETTVERAGRAYEGGAVSDIEMMEAEARRDAAKAAVQAAQAAVDTAELDLSYTEIRAPIAGRLARSYVDVGNLVGSGETTLLTTIVVDDPIHVYFNADERALLQALRDRPRDDPQRKPRPLSLQLADGTEYPITGLADFAENRVDPLTGTLQIRAVFDNPDGELYPGFFVRVLMPRETAEAMLVPEVSLQRDLAGPFVLVVDETGMVHRRDVELGDRVGPDRVIASGLEPGERVIVNGLQRARPGIQVDAREAETAARAAPASPETPGGNG